MDWCKLFKEYAANPENFWPSTHLRNARKIKKNIDEGGKLRGENRKEYVDNLLRLAYLRAGFDPKHFYLVNAGSSGSHWIEAMLNLLPGFYSGGEIYFPKKIKDILPSFGKDEAELFLDVVYLLHSGGIYKDSLSSVLSNSSHLADHGQISKYSKDKVTVLLLRNPVDVVMSRTFRKDEYKNDVAPGLDEKKYLDKNCSYLEKFYENLDYESFDLIIKYEEFVSSPKKNLQELAALLKIRANDSDLDVAILKTSKSEEVKSVTKGFAPLTNVYLGEKKDHGWAREYIKERLKDVIERHGYA